VFEQIKKAKKDSDPSHYELACLHAKIGLKDEAFEYLEKAFQERSFMIAVIGVDPQLDSLRNDPRYGDLLRRTYGR
jgi:hypothetical protein